LQGEWFERRFLTFRLERPRGGERWMSKLADFQIVGDSVSLTKIGDKAFTVVKVEDSDYTKGDEVTKGVKITTKEPFSIDGKSWSKFHTTRIAVVKRLSQADIRESINGGTPMGPVKCVSAKTANGKDFFNLVDA